MSLSRDAQVRERICARIVPKKAIPDIIRIRLRRSPITREVKEAVHTLIDAAVHFAKAVVGRQKALHRGLQIGR